MNDLSVADNCLVCATEKPFNVVHEWMEYIMIELGSNTEYWVEVALIVLKKLMSTSSGVQFVLSLYQAYIAGLFH